MRFHGVEMVGSYLMQDVDTGVDTNFEARRLVYDNGSMYFGNGAVWVGIEGFAAGTVMWFYQAAAPTGWTLVAEIADDQVLGVKSSGGTYNSAGNLRGSWSTGFDHSHGNGSLATNHNHKWHDYISGSGNENWSWQSNGSSAIDMAANIEGGTDTRGLFGRITSADGYKFDADFYTQDTTSNISGTTDLDSMSTARPYARVGVLATKD